jgi:hypothetical protein
MIDDTKEIPEVSRQYYRDTSADQQTTRLLIIDACGFSKAAYDKLKKGWMDAIGKPGMYTVSSGRHDPTAPNS